MIINNTPIEPYQVSGRVVWVKREDLSTPSPGPPFSKVRGLIPALQRMKNEGITTVGYTETSVSMAGWGVAWACKHLGMKAVLFDPQYKNTPPLLSYHRKQWERFHPDIIPIKAGMAKVNWHISRKILLDCYPHSELLPLGLVLPETVEGTAEEVQRSNFADLLGRIGSLVVNVGSGTIAAGIVKALPDVTVYGAMGRSGDQDRKKEMILHKAGLMGKGFFKSKLTILDPGWAYTQPSKHPCPFPSHPFYDLKAWQWLCENIEKLKEPIVFWNIGRVK